MPTPLAGAKGRPFQSKTPGIRKNAMILRMATISLLLVSLFSVELQAQPVKEHGQLSLKGTQLVDEHGKATVLNGVSFGWHGTIEATADCNGWKVEVIDLYSPATANDLIITGDTMSGE